MRLGPFLKNNHCLVRDSPHRKGQEFCVNLPVVPLKPGASIQAQGGEDGQCHDKVRLGVAHKIGGDGRYARRESPIGGNRQIRKCGRADQRAGVDSDPAIVVSECADFGGDDAGGAGRTLVEPFSRPLVGDRSEPHGGFDPIEQRTVGGPIRDEAARDAERGDGQGNEQAGKGRPNRPALRGRRTSVHDPGERR